ncbi:MAG: hypothetical protein ABIP17_09225 [Ilumatobacteraceae bacterium]
MNNTTESSLSISCDDCSMQCTDSCDDCLVTFLMSADDVDRTPDHHETLVLDVDQARVVQMFGKAGLVPDLKYRVAG